MIRVARYALLVNLVVLVVVENVHKVGSVPALDYLRHMSHPTDSRLLFLTPCHQTPYTSFLHNSHYQLDMLECAPRLDLAEQERNKESIFRHSP